MPARHGKEAKTNLFTFYMKQWLFKLAAKAAFLIKVTLLELMNIKLRNRKFNYRGLSWHLIIKAFYIKMVLKKFCCASVVFLLLLVPIISGDILT